MEKSKILSEKMNEAHFFKMKGLTLPFFMTFYEATFIKTV